MICLALIVLPHVGAFQTFLGREVSKALAEKLNTEVTVGKIQLGLPNEAIINDVSILDQHRQPLLDATRLAAQIELMPLIQQGKIVIDALDLYAVNANLYRNSADEDFNFKFFIDAFASKDTTHTPLDLAIRDIKIKNSNIRFRDCDMDVAAKDFDALLVLNHLTDDSLDAELKKLSCKVTSKAMKLDGFEISNLASRVKLADNNNLQLTGFILRLPKTSLNLTAANYSLDTKSYSAEIGKSYVSTRDVEPFVDKIKGLNRKLNFSGKVSGVGSDVNIEELNVLTDDGGLLLEIRNNTLRTLDASASTIGDVMRIVVGNEIEQITQLGDISYRGLLKNESGNVVFDGNLETSLGILDLDGEVDKVGFDVTVSTPAFDLNAIIGGENDFGNVAIDNLHANGKLDLSQINVKGLVKSFDYNGYSYSNINVDGSMSNGNVDGTIAINDPNGGADLALKSTIGGSSNAIDVTGSVKDFNPNAMRLTSDFAGTNFTTDIQASINGRNLDDIIGDITISNFIMKSPKDEIVVDNLSLSSKMENGQRLVSLSSDFAQMDIKGKFDVTTLAGDIIYAVKSRLPSIPGLPDTKSDNTNQYSFDISVKSTDILKKFVDLPLELTSPMNINGVVDGAAKQMNIDVFLPKFALNDSEYKDGEIIISTPDEKMLCKVFVSKLLDNDEYYNINVDAEAVDNMLNTKIVWENPYNSTFRGRLNAETEFFKDENGKAAMNVDIDNSEVVFKEAVWKIAPSSVKWAGNKLNVDNFVLQHEAQYLKISGIASDSKQDSLTVDLRDVNVENILNAVNFHSVEFAGLATGNATIKSAFNNPDANAKICVNNFLFQYGALGVLNADVEWNKQEKQIDIDAFIEDDEHGTIKVDGYVSPSKGYIDLLLLPTNVNIDFLHSFIGGVMDRVEGRGSGHLNVVGPLSTVQLVGAMSPYAKLHVRALNTEYEVRGDSIYFVPDDILFKDVKAYDRYGNFAVCNGGVHHKHLTRLTFDLGLHTDKLLAYETKTFGNDTFYGTVFTEGDVMMKGISGQVNIDGDVTPLEGTTFTYNAVVQNYLNTQEFITFRDKTKLNLATPLQPDLGGTTDEGKEIKTNLYCNFNINITPNVQLRLLMDDTSDDYIVLYGNGQVKANYYNKGSFGLYGLYTVDHGSYGVSIQNVIHKDFTFKEGGTITFVGEPYDAALNLQASHLVSGVSLSDLSIGNSFANNTIRVNCLMNITGTPEVPIVNFDLDMPTVNADEKQMIRSLIESEEDMNQQVMYLLGIGRFYTKATNNAGQTDANRDQTSLAMQSLLSGTVSSQLNNMLGQFLTNKNWNIGANIYTGVEGWNNAQYEGTVSGRMLNNRLLFNGQFGYRDNVKTANTSFIGDFELQYLLLPSGNLSVRAYNQANERYFTKSSLNTQGIGLLMKKDFTNLRDLFSRRKKTSGISSNQ